MTSNNNALTINTGANALAINAALNAGNALINIDGAAITANASGTITTTGDVDINGDSINIAGVVTAGNNGIFTAITGDLLLTANNAINNFNSISITSGNNLTIINTLDINIDNPITLGISDTITLQATSLTFTGSGSLDAGNIDLRQPNNTNFSFNGTETFNIDLADIGTTIFTNTTALANRNLELGEQTNYGTFYLATANTAVDLELNTVLNNFTIYSNKHNTYCKDIDINGASAIIAGSTNISPGCDPIIFPTNPTTNTTAKPTLKPALEPIIPIVKTKTIIPVFSKIENAAIKISNARNEIIQLTNIFNTINTPTKSSIIDLSAIDDDLYSNNNLFILDTDDIARRILEGNKLKKTIKKERISNILQVNSSPDILNKNDKKLNNQENSKMPKPSKNLGWLPNIFNNDDDDKKK